MSIAHTNIQHLSLSDQHSLAGFYARGFPAFPNSTDRRQSLDVYKRQEHGSLFGDALALIGAAFIAGHWLTGRAARRNLPALGFMTFVYGVTALFLLLISPLAGGLRVTGESLYGIVVLAVACTLGGHALMTYLLGFVSADVVSFALLAEPIGAAVWALALFHEQVTFPLLVGGLTVIVGLMLYTYGEMKAGKQ